MTLQIRKRYDPSTGAGSITFEAPSCTEQQFKDDSDVNIIISRCFRAGVCPHVETEWPEQEFDDLDFHAASQLLAQAQENFDAIPENVRERFNNNPSKYFAFLQDPENAQEAIKLGLALPPAPRKEEPTSSPLDITGRTDTKSVEGT